MKRVLFFAAFLTLIPSLFTSPAYAAGSSVDLGNVVTSCGTPNSTYSVGQNKAVTVDTTGVTCTSSSGGGGGNVTITSPIGQTTMSGSVSTTIASDQSTLPVTPLDSGGTNMTNTGTHSLNVNVVSSTGVLQGSTSSGQTVAPIGCRTLTAAPTDLTAQTNMPSCTIGGALRVDASGTTQPVSGSVTVTQATGTNLHAVLDTTSTTAVTGSSSAGDTTTSLKVVPIGVAAATGCSSASLANAQINLTTQDLLGNLCVKASPQITNTVNGSGSATSTTSTQCVALVSSKSLYIMSFDITNSNASAFVVTLQDGSGGTALWSGNVPAGSGITKFGVTPLLHTASGNGLYFAVTGGGSTVYCNASGFSQ